MTVPDELAFALRRLEESGVEYLVTGSLASVTWGRPRATYDADVVVGLAQGDIDRLLAVFPIPDWYLDRQTIDEARRSGGEFNAIHGPSATKIDFWVRGNRPADVARFLRRRRAKINGVECWVLSPEDSILAKLEWSKLAPSERQRGDIVGVLEVQGAAIDFEYLRDWASRLNVRRELEAIISSPSPGADSKQA